MVTGKNLPDLEKTLDLNFSTVMELLKVWRFLEMAKCIWYHEIDIACLRYQGWNTVLKIWNVPPTHEQRLGL